MNERKEPKGNRYTPPSEQERSEAQLERQLFYMPYPGEGGREMPQGVGAVMAYIEGKLHNMRGIVQTQEMYKYKQPLNVQPALRKGAEAAVQRLGEIREEMAQGQYGKARMELHHDIRVATDFLEFQIGLRNPQGRIPVTDNLRWIVRSAVTLDHLENLQRQLSNPNANQPRLPHLESVSNSRSRMWYNEG